MVLVIVNYNNEYATEPRFIKCDNGDEKCLEDWSFYSMSFLLFRNPKELLVYLGTVLVQLGFIFWVLWWKGLQKNPSKIFLLSFSLLTILQRLLPFTKILLLPCFEWEELKSEHHHNKHFLEPIWIKSWLYIDFFSYFFYQTTIFSMIFHRFLVLKSKEYPYRLLIFCVLFSIIGSILSIEMSEIRLYFDIRGIVGDGDFFEKLFSRVCFIFPIGSIIFWYLIRSTKNRIIYTGALITAIFYGILLILNETIRSRWSMYSMPAIAYYGRLYLDNFGIITCVPQVFLPIFVIIIRKKSA